MLDIDQSNVHSVLDSNPINWGSRTWVFIVALTSLGGVVNWVSGKKRTIMELIGELATSISVGITAFLVLMGFEYSILVACGAGIAAGHVGVRLIFALQNIIAAKEHKIIESIEGEK